MGIYFAQSKATIDMASATTDLTSSDDDDDEDETDQLLIAQDGSLKKRKKPSSDPMNRKIKKIRKNFEGNITFVDEENGNSQESEEQISSEKLPSGKVLKDSLSSNIDLTAKNKSVIESDSNKDKENVCESEETLEGLDDFFSEEWSYQKDTVEEFDGFFEEDFSYDEKPIADLNTPKRCIIIDIIWEKTESTLTVREESNEASAIVKCSGIW